MDNNDVQEAFKRAAKARGETVEIHVTLPCGLELLTVVPARRW